MGTRKVGSTDSVRIDGLIELQRSLREIDKTLPRELRKINLEAAKKVQTTAEGTARSLGGVQAKAADSIRAMAEQRGAMIRIDANKYPYAFGAEFGSIRFKQFPAFKGSGADAGYFVWPSIRAERDEIVQMYDEKLTELWELTK